MDVTVNDLVEEAVTAWLDDCTVTLGRVCEGGVDPRAESSRRIAQMILTAAWKLASGEVGLGWYCALARCGPSWTCWPVRSLWMPDSGRARLALNAALAWHLVVDQAVGRAVLERCSDGRMSGPGVRPGSIAGRRAGFSR